MFPNTDARDRKRTAVLNLPNQLTSLRLILAVIMFCMITREHYFTSTVLFIIAAATDWLDGYFARKYGQVTTLGRILDPFADKVIICGTFVFLVAEPQITAGPWGLKAWMVVVIVGRELLVTALRSSIKQQGFDFSAKMSGKLKMVFQCVAAGTSLFYLWYHSPSATAFTWIQISMIATALGWLLVVSIWVSVLLTIYSGAVYVQAAIRLLRR